MIAKSIALVALVTLAVVAAGWASVKLYFFIRRESDLERQSNLETRNAAEDALHRLDAATKRFKRKGK